eukprot:Pompholyxophrys_punicea_v1_NODE_506_length_1821_cov_8.150623.p1 type:complete len:441 gc:universal NODE_506_length_1821_cov_8.150623:390-1712(+)
MLSHSSVRLWGLSVMECVKNLTLDGRTVICTIHQPSSDIFELFNKILLMSLGHVVYHGSPQDALVYFEKMGYSCPQYSNPAHFFMKILHSGVDVHQVPQPNVELTKRLSVIQSAAEKEVRQRSKSQRSRAPSVQIPQFTPVEVRQLRQPWYREWLLISHRALINYVRQPLAIQVRLGQTIFVALLLGLIYFNLDNNQRSIQDRTGAIFFLLTSCVMSSLQPVILTFPNERMLFMREYDNNMYSVVSYYSGKVLTEFPFQIIFPVVFSSVSYYMVGFNPLFSKFLLQIVALFFVTLCGNAMGMLVGCAVTDPLAAVSLGPVVIIPLMLFGGFYVNTESLPVYLAWISYISVFNWGFQAISIVEYSGLVLRCDPDEYIPNPEQGGEPVCPVTLGDSVLESLSIDPDGYWIAIIVIAALVAFFHLASLVLLKLQTISQNAARR